MLALDLFLASVILHSVDLNHNQRGRKGEKNIDIRGTK